MPVKLISFVVMIFIWQVISFFVNSNILPTPFDVVYSLKYHFFEDDLLYHLSITLYKVLVAFIIAMVIGVFIGVLMGTYKTIDRSLDFFLILGLNMPALVTIILCYIWFGLTDFSAILAVVINKVPTVIVTIREGAKAINIQYMQIAKVYKLSSNTTFTKIYLPQMYPYIVASSRAGLSLIWKIVLVVELLGRSSGVGFQLSMFFQFFDISSILAYSFAFIFVVLFIENYILTPIDKKFTSWR